MAQLKTLAVSASRRDLIPTSQDRENRPPKIVLWPPTPPTPAHHERGIYCLIGALLQRLEMFLPKPE